MVDIQNLSFSYSRKKKNVLDDFSMFIADGGVYGLLGPNGVGKSTLLYLISGLLTPTAGCCRIDGIDSRLRLPETLKNVFLVPEEFEFPSVSLRTFVDLNSRFYPNFDEAEMRGNLEIFGLGEDLNLQALSMGQRKKVMLAFAIACNTRVVLMDEPTNGLDIPGKALFRRLISGKANDERLFIISTHQVRDIDSLLDHILIMDKTRVLLNASIDEIQQKLLFENTNDEETIARSLHHIPGLNGTNVIMENTFNEDTRLNLETLFDFAFANPTLLSSLFKNENSIES